MEVGKRYVAELFPINNKNASSWRKNSHGSPFILIKHENELPFSGEDSRENTAQIQEHRLFGTVLAKQNLKKRNILIKIIDGPLYS